MSGIYRGPGGTGDAVNDSSSETRLAVEARDAAIAAKVAAEAAQAAAETAETNAELAETNAETAETNAETAEANAETAEANAEAAQAAAEAAQAAAEAAQTAAELAETNAELAETNAETAETNAETAASLAQDWATKLSTPVAGGEYSAKYHAQAAASSATDAQTAENNAETAQAAAEAARDAALASLDSFDDRYLGTKSSDPTLDNDGNALVAGALYFNTVSNTMKVYTGTVWVDAYADGNTFLAKANNLSDLANTATARTNLGVAIGVNVQAYDADLDAFAAKTAPTGAVVGTSDTQTLTNKTIALGSNTVSGTLAQFNTAVTDADFASIAGTETLTNKTLTSPVISGGSINNATVGASTASTGAFTTLSASGAFSANGGTTLGDASGDALTINSSAVSIPNGLNFDANTLVIDATNNRVGVGTASPSHVLQVAGFNGVVANFSASVQSGVQIASGGAFNPFLNFFSSGTTAEAGIVAIAGSAALTFTTTSAGTERMRISSAGSVGIGTNNPIYRLHIAGGNAFIDTGYNYTAATGGGYWASGGNTYAVGWYESSGSMLFRTATTERMRITSTGNVGIGITAPAEKLTLGAAGKIQVLRSDNARGGEFFADNTGTHLTALATGNDPLFLESLGASGQIRFTTGGTERMRLDSSGNLGLGVTPSAWRETFVRALQVGDTGVSFSAGTVALSTDQYMDICNNGYKNSAGDWIYTRSKPSIRYEGFNNQHRWYNAPSGTAGNAITFTQAMTLDASGNLGIGTTSPTSYASKFIEVSNATSAGLKLTAGTSGVNLGSSVEYVASDKSLRLVTYEASSLMRFYTVGTERMRIDSSGRLLVGTASASGSNLLQITGDATISGLTVGKGGGAVASATAIGYLALNATNTSPTTAIGYQALKANTTGRNTSVGVNSSLANTTGSNNTVVGDSAFATNTTGSSNVAVGDNALQANTTASNNTSLGYQAGYNNTTGGNNIAIGALTLYSNTAGSSNTAVGSGQTGSFLGALGSNTTGGNNTAIGQQALQSNTTASNNTAVGRDALYSNTTASFNTAVGYQAGTTVTTGQYNSFFGVQAGQSLTTGNGNTFIGYSPSTGGAGSAITTGSKNVILGGYTGNNGGLDIRTANNHIVLSDGDGNPKGYFDNSGYFYLGTSNVDIRVPSNGGIAHFGYMTSGSQLQVSYNSVSSGVSLGSGATSWGTFSDERLKNVTGTYFNALADIAQIQPVKFTWKNDPDNKPQVGVIAQSVQSVVPEAMDSTTYEMNGDTEYLQVRYTELIPLMIASIQELKAEVDSLKQQINGA